MEGVSDSSSSDSDDGMELAPADMEALMKLEGELEGNPNLYDTHVQVRDGSTVAAAR